MNGTSEVWLGLGSLVLVVLNASLNASEAALGTLRPHHLRLVRELDPARSERLQSLLEARETRVAACGLARRIVRLGLVIIVLSMAPPVARMLAGGEPSVATVLLSTIVVGVPVAFVNVFAGELVPRAYGGANPVAALSRLRRLVEFVSAVLAPPARALVALADRFAARYGESSEGALEEEIKTLAESGEETGQIESEERDLIHSVFEFADTVAREIMTPRVDLDAMSITSNPEDVVRIIEETGHSRIPLYEETDDNILGVVHAKDLLGAMAQGRKVDLRRLLRKVLTVPEGMGVRELLGEMRSARTQMAVVQDEFGGTAGIVTIEDIVEELVGDIVDEYDPVESDLVEMDGGWILDGKMHLDDLNEAIGTPFDSDEFDTVGGFVFGQFGRQPTEGESIDVDSYRFTVTQTDGRRIEQLRVEPIGEPGLDGLDEA